MFPLFSPIIYSFFLGAKFEFQRKEKWKQKGRGKKEEKKQRSRGGQQEVEFLRSKYSVSCEIPSRAGYNSIREGRACFSTASPRKDQPWPTSNFTALTPRDQSSFTHHYHSESLCREGTMDWRARTGPVDPLENSNGRSWPRLCEPRRHHRILRILFTAGVWMRARAHCMASRGTLSPSVTREF